MPVEVCGRFALSHSAEELSALLALPFPQQSPRYNIAPGQKILAVIRKGRERMIDNLSWGLIPHWSKERPKNQPINARAETVTEKPFFRSAFKKRRCVIPASGFYEWKAAEKHKQPHYVYPPDNGLFLLAGIWEEWAYKDVGKQELLIHTCAIVTMEAADKMRELHHRTPATITRENLDTWLDQDVTDAQDLLERPKVEWYPVSTYVNDPRNEGKKCVDKVAL